MGRTISLLLTPGAAGDSVPDIYLDSGGVWKAPPIMNFNSENAVSLARQQFAKVLHDTGALLDHHPDQVDTGAIEAEGAALFVELLPHEVRAVLRGAIQDAAAEPPVLRIHAVHRHDWIPWELLFDSDSQKFLGMHFIICRLPVVQNPPDVSLAQPHLVRAVHNLLSPGVADPPDALFDTWKDTFTGLTNGAQVQMRPHIQQNNPDWPTVAVVKQALQSAADILHVTSHGRREFTTVDGRKESDLLLDLDPNAPISTMRALGAKQVNAFQRSRSGPLVFANACNPQGLDAADRLESSGLGKAFFEKGALNVIGTAAPVSRTLALAFARKFYENLLSAPGKSVGSAMLAAKQHFAGLGGNDPSYLFYSLYGPAETRFEVH